MFKSFFKWFISFPGLFIKIFNRQNLIKFFIIFSVGFLFRFFIVSFWNVNVFFEFTHYISLIYYSFMSFFAVVVHEFVSYFDIFILPKINFDALKLSSNRKAISSIFFSDKMFLYYDNKNTNISYIDFHNLNSLNKFNFDSFKNTGKRDLYWVFWEKHFGDFNSYKEFREKWNPDISVRSEVKKDIKGGLYKIRRFNKTIKRILDSFRPDK